MKNVLLTNAIKCVGVKHLNFQFVSTLYSGHHYIELKLTLTTCQWDPFNFKLNVKCKHQEI